MPSGEHPFDDEMILNKNKNKNKGSDVAVGANAKTSALVDGSAPVHANITEEQDLNAGDPGVDWSPSIGQEGGGEQGGNIYTQF